eukprot:5072391-Pyramimonas_sp.AAC.1
MRSAEHIGLRQIVPAALLEALRSVILSFVGPPLLRTVLPSSSPRTSSEAAGALCRDECAQPNGQGSALERGVGEWG